jgi:hypothetical protein
MPARIKALPVFRGYPVPWFVAWVNGEPEFRTADGAKWRDAISWKLCWVCGERLGSKMAFVLGPMCGITRTTSEPPCHRECALWSIQNCPFLTRPGMVRREGNMPEGHAEPPGIMIRRNPAVTLLWVTNRFTLFRIEDGSRLISVGDPIEVEYYQEGRPATGAEVESSIAGGLPALYEVAAKQGPKACEALHEQIKDFSNNILAKAKVLPC